MKEKKYFFALKITKERSALALKCGEEILGKREWQEARDMGRRLFEGIAGLLKENNLQPQEVSDFVVDSDMPEGYTSMRIAETVRKVYQFAVKKKEVERSESH